MKAIFLALFVVAVTAIPLPEDNGSDAVEMIVNGVPDDAALELSDVVDIKLNEHSDGAVVATNLLHPYTAVGLAEAAAAAAPAAPVDVVNDVAVVDNPMARNLNSMPVIIPRPVPVVVPRPVPVPSEDVVAEPVVLPLPAVPEVVVEPEQLPVASPQFHGELFNDGVVQVQYNGPEEPGMFSTLQNWFSMVVNYFNAPSSSPAAPEPRH